MTINIINDFKRFLTIDMALNRLTVANHTWKVKRFLEFVDKPVDSLVKEDVRKFLEVIKQQYSLNTYCCYLKALKRFLRDYLGKEELSNFRFPSLPFIPKTLDFDKHDLQRFYDAVEHPVVKMMFLGYCVTGLRRNDIMYLMREELKKDMRMIIKNTGSRTKHRWITFYNDELEELLHPYLDSRNDNNPRVFPVSKWKTFPKYWYGAQSRTGLKITPKDLRDWFCNEMLELDVPERYVDAFCGRVPQTVLRRNYADYNPMKLKEIYDSAGLTVLS